jgi:hypothetical protein
MIAAGAMAMCLAGPVLVRMPGLLVIVAAATLDRITHASQHASPGGLRHLGSSHR